MRIENLRKNRLTRSFFQCRINREGVDEMKERGGNKICNENFK